MSGVSEADNIAVVQKYFEGCSTGDLETLLATLTPDVVHYFLDDSVQPIRGADHLARYWRKYRQVLDPTWSIDHAVAQGDEVVIEWSCIWTPKGREDRIVLRGTDWYVLRGGRIAEIRAYFIQNNTGDTGLAGFPYSERGYLTTKRT
jgi:ketosteroid isomerase-like protein